MRKHTVAEVFGIGVGNATPAYVDRGQLDARFNSSLNANRHVSVHGGSKQGKTWLRKRALAPDKSIVVQCTITATSTSILEEALAQIGVTATLKKTKSGSLAGEVQLSANVAARAAIPGAGVSGKTEATARGGMTADSELEEYFLAQTVANLHWVSWAINRSGKRFVIEDFHYLPTEEQRVFSYWVKALGEYGCHVLVIGVWAQSHLLSYFNGDLEGRVDDFHLKWSDTELREVLDKGASALSISFSNEISEKLVRDSYGNVGLLHRLAYQICVLADVDDQPAGSTVESLEVLAMARREVASQMSGRFETFASNFVRGMRRMPEGLVVYLHLLRAFTETDDSVLLDRGVDSSDLLRAIQSEGAQLRGSDLTQALERIDQLQVKIEVSPPVLTYHRPGKRVQLVDRSFLFFRKYGEHSWPWNEEEQITNDLADSNPLDIN